jgi:hypothetical protein
MAMEERKQTERRRMSRGIEKWPYLFYVIVLRRNCVLGFIDI